MTKESNLTADKKSLKNSLNWKIIPIILVYQLWVVGLLQAFGWLPALSSFLVTGAWISGYPKGVLRNILFLIVFALIIPFTLIISFGIEANPIIK